MAETAQDVFDELWERYELACNDLKPEFGQGCPRGPRGLSEYDMTIRQRFANALKSKDKKQLECPSCHRGMSLINDVQNSGPLVTIKAKDGVCPELSVYDASIEVEYGAAIEYCPMCGRRLEEE
jgi:hypothetical protein